MDGCKPAEALGAKAALRKQQFGIWRVDGHHLCQDPLQLDRCTQVWFQTPHRSQACPKGPKLRHFEWPFAEASSFMRKPRWPDRWISPAILD